jgi:hypothetical protein
LPSGTRIRAVTPPYLLATKFEAFRGRGQDAYLASADFEDIVRLVDGREGLPSEVEAAPSDVRAFVAGESDAFARSAREPLTSAYVRLAFAISRF